MGEIFRLGYTVCTSFKKGYTLDFLWEKPLSSLKSLLVLEVNETVALKAEKT